MQPLIPAHDLKALIAEKNIVLIDARNTPDTFADYKKGHLPGALFADVNKDLADIKATPADGGRHPLPSADAFTETLGKWGIHTDTHVIVYDDKNGANAAARLWWMLRSIGHEKVQVLDGGMQAALNAGIALEAGEQPAIKATEYPSTTYAWPVADMEETEKFAAQENTVVIDVRDAARYRGETEPIDIIAGHIPGAVNIPFTDNLNADGTMKSPGELKKIYADHVSSHQPENIIVHCGSGVTACHTLLAMDHAGFTMPKLYTGSWSEWCNNKKPVATS